MYAATVNEQRLTFDVECVWRRNMVIRDRETGTLWQQATGEALIGPLQGEQLTLLGGELLTWAGWKTAHPTTFASLEPEVWTGMLPKERVTAVLEKITYFVSKIAPGKTPNDKRLPPYAAIVGILIDGIVRAYPLAVLQEMDVIKEMVNGKNIRIEHDVTTDLVRAFIDGEAIMIKRTWWLGWYEFHPQTTLYKLERENDL